MTNEFNNDQTADSVNDIEPNPKGSKGTYKRQICGGHEETSYGRSMSQ